MKSKLFKEQNPLKQVFLALGIITGFIFIVAISTLYVSDAIRNNNACGCVIPIPYMIILLSSLGIFVGSFAYYFIASKYIKENKEIEKDIKFTLRFLERDEREVIQYLISEKKPVIQSNIERNTKYHKVKIHRILDKLLKKEIIEKKSQGKVKKIYLKKELIDLFIK